MAARAFLLESSRALRKRLLFTWDGDTGELTGPDAEFLREWVDVAIRAGSAVISPHPTVLPIIDPLRSALELGAVLEGLGFRRLPSPFVEALTSYRMAALREHHQRSEQEAGARDFLAQQIELQLVAEPPAFYGVDTSTLDVFRVVDSAARVGASRYVGVCKVTGRVQDLGMAGE